MSLFAKISKLALCLAICTSCARQNDATSLDTTLPSGATVSVTAITPNIIKVTNAAADQAVLPSRATVLEDASAFKKSGSGHMSMKTATGVEVTLDGSTGAVTINAGKEKTITDAGLRNLADGLQEITLETSSTGSFYGAGERGHKLNLRGDTLVMYNRQNYGYTKGDSRINQMNITMPLIISSDGFALLFDDYAAAKLILGNDSQIKYETESPAAISYYFINGASTIADVTKELSALTGRQPLPPLWSLGYITSKYGYHNEKETLGAIDSLKQRGYPVDGIVLDLYWYGKEEDMGRLAWDPDQWPNPEKMLSDLKEQNVNLIAISQPYVLRNGRGLDNYNYLSSNGLLLADSTGQAPQEVKIWVGEGGMFDVSNPKTKEWLSNRYKQLTDMGVSGWWGDLGEPEVHPESGLHNNGLTTRLYHNQYGNDWSEIVYNLFQKQYPDTRLITMMRGGTTGLQRYSVFPWSTDVSRSWEGMQPQVTIMLNSGLSGLGYMGHDVGGFAVDKANPEDAELYVRWLQLGLFSPMLRTHAQYKAEPYHYPQYADIILKLVKDRYRWLPYNYTLAYENAKYGYPLVRPLNFYEAGSNAYDAIDDEYLWGSEVLVAPVMQKGASERQVTFPQGTWVDFRNPKQIYAGGSTITYPAPLDVLPLFVKGGAFIPMAEYAMNSTADYNPADLTVQYYPVQGIESHFSIYDDNRVSASAIDNDQYRLINLQGNYTGKEIIVKLSVDGNYTGAADSIGLTLVYNGISAYESVDIDAGEAQINTVDGNLHVKLTYDVKTKPTITVKI